MLDTVFYMCRTFAYALHRRKLVITGKWPFATNNLSNNDHNNQTNIAGAVAPRQDVTGVPPSAGADLCAVSPGSADVHTSHSMLSV